MSLQTEPVSDVDLDSIPTYTIDLSLPPRLRYTQLATDFGPRMRTLTPLYDETISSIIPYTFLRRVINFLAKVFLRRLYCSEETEELKGMSKILGVDMWLLVAFNVLLDCLLGCTSGGVVVSPKLFKSVRTSAQEGAEERKKRIMHFRTLDWGMDGLKSLIVALEFIRSDSSDPNEVIARVVTYAGFVGCLTGVRKSLSVSLNFRPTHSCSILSLRAHQLLVLMGCRPSIASILRSYIIPSHINPQMAVRLDIAQLGLALASTPTAPCYLTICSGTEIAVIEKDLAAHDTRITRSKNFIVITNHDVESSNPGAANGESAVQSENEGRPERLTSSMFNVEDIIRESKDRRDCIENKWKAYVKKTRRAAGKDVRESRNQDSEGTVAVPERRLQKWVEDYPITNECTHFACIMDPRMGSIRWLKRGSNFDDYDNDRVSLDIS